MRITLKLAYYSYKFISIVNSVENNHNPIDVSLFIYLEFCNDFQFKVKKNGNKAGQERGMLFHLYPHLSKLSPSLSKEGLEQGQGFLVKGLGKISCVLEDKKKKNLKKLMNQTHFGIYNN